MEFSEFGQKFTSRTGILSLMDDLGKAMSGEGKKYMLGGGNPAHIDAINGIWRRRLHEILEEPEAMERMLANYDPPQGNPRFVSAMAGLLSREFGWDVRPENIAVTNGSQSSFYILFNMIAGPDGKGGRKRILFPVVPEYIGYADQSLSSGDFIAERPRVEELDEHTFKYHVDFEHLTIPPDAGAICFSRPTNPTGNVLTDEEVLHLDAIARDSGIPLILDNAYGVPFPGMIFCDATPIWNDNIILGMSLSKIGLPSTRTGIIVARPEIISAVSSCNAILSLANGSVGQTITTPLIESGEILSIARNTIRPFYREKSLKAREWLHEAFTGSPVKYAVHAAEGSLFLWLWFKNLSITTMELYERLKKRNTIVVPGQYFFFGLDEVWSHKDECIRLNYAMADEDVREGFRIIAEEASLAVQS
jgi:valine--pyruvate aminotransferase